MANQPPSKDDPSPPSRVAGRSRRTTPASTSQQSEERRRNVVNSLMEIQGSQAFEEVSRLPNMPQRSEYPAHEAWMRAMLTSSLRQSDELSELFGHGLDDDINNDGRNQGDRSGDGTDGGGRDDHTESKDDTAQ